MWHKKLISRRELQAFVCKNGFVIDKMAGKLSAERAYKRQKSTETQTTSNKPETRTERESKNEQN